MMYEWVFQYALDNELNLLEVVPWYMSEYQNMLSTMAFLS